MNTLILYATKHGAAREIAERIAAHMDTATLHDLKQANIPSPADFDCVIIGSALYAGTIRKEVKHFLSQNETQLRGKKIGLFLSGMGTDNEQTHFSNNFPPDLLQTASATGLLGGIFDPRKAGALERLIMKVVTKQSGYTNTISDEKIARFAETMRA